MVCDSKHKQLYSLGVSQIMVRRAWCVILNTCNSISLGVSHIIWLDVLGV